jgi:hypothetical protein
MLSMQPVRINMSVYTGESLVNATRRIAGLMQLEEMPDAARPSRTYVMRDNTMVVANVLRDNDGYSFYVVPVKVMEAPDAG